MADAGVSYGGGLCSVDVYKRQSLVRLSGSVVRQMTGIVWYTEIRYVSEIICEASTPSR